VPSHFGPPLGRGAGTAPPQWGGETLVLLDCPTSEPLRRAIFSIISSTFDLWSRPWCVADYYGVSAKFLRVPIVGRGQLVPPPPLVRELVWRSIHLKEGLKEY